MIISLLWWYWSLCETSCTKTNTFCQPNLGPFNNFTFGSDWRREGSKQSLGQAPVCVVPGANCYWSAGPWLIWSQSATPNGCNAWLLPEDIFKIDRICTPLPILLQMAVYLDCHNKSFDTRLSGSKEESMICVSKEWRREVVCYVSLVSTPGPQETHLHLTIWCQEWWGACGY